MRETFHVLVFDNAAFTHHNSVFGNSRRQSFRHLELRLKGSEISIVDPDELDVQAKCPVEFFFVVYLDQYIHAEPKRDVYDPARIGVREARHDHENAIGAPSARFENLIRLEEEILAKNR